MQYKRKCCYILDENPVIIDKFKSLGAQTISNIPANNPARGINPVPFLHIDDLVYKKYHCYEYCMNKEIGVY